MSLCLCERKRKRSKWASQVYANSQSHIRWHFIGPNEEMNKCEHARIVHSNLSRTHTFTHAHFLQIVSFRLLYSCLSQKAYLIRSLPSSTPSLTKTKTKFPFLLHCCSAHSPSLPLSFNHFRIHNRTEYTEIESHTQTHAHILSSPCSHFHFYFHFGGKFYSITTISFPLNLILLTQWMANIP